MGGRGGGRQEGVGLWVVIMGGPIVGGLIKKILSRMGVRVRGTHGRDKKA